jgi:hypothetical protein
VSDALSHIREGTDTPPLAETLNIGTAIHDTRHRYVNLWLENNKRPESIKDFLPEPDDPFGMTDARIISGSRAYENFCIRENYEPVGVEIPVYSLKLGVAGTLDDLGFLGGELGDLALIDLKSGVSKFKKYFLQVKMYSMMLKECLGLSPKRNIILNASKTDGAYKISDIRCFGKLSKGVRAAVTQHHILALIQKEISFKETIKI